MTCIHDLADWPNLTWDDRALAQPLAAMRHREGRLIGRMEALRFPLREAAVLRNPGRGSAEVQRDRGRSPGQRPGPLLHYRPPGYGRRWPGPGG
ncbi:DUF4172 domain-containing protein [Brevundimonas intermedia]|uniref:DUF4172 domain-containing protein n=1 Tax=Brevundimonas intermedia TaxID=74315 RepID=UPI002475D764|nr:DUF4172 domain-containing protein [Brevundimonas intermedia]